MYYMCMLKLCQFVPLPSPDRLATVRNVVTVDLPGIRGAGGHLPRTKPTNKEPGRNSMNDDEFALAFYRSPLHASGDENGRQRESKSSHGPRRNTPVTRVKTE